ncbi:hypothetical protein P4493_04200 [Bacillus thuringiensis]|uniref:Uncharacterized protein n=3 Tax=Bacillus thuringiensis TaxID=1428 RepID=A0A0B5NIU7_BACTU|nr:MULTISPECIES: hypothetical protein [Bacillus]EAO56897.1 hypothetical protein RBTH_07425 [Bacillus thuringiensis serovar israelensis ATCC 35646]MEC2535478.1 hypothetical protein [Bacillus cereus]MED1153808.1 hypothetical protein [Bacillus paranthracis]OUB09333.1 hypothetical protein BK708_32935 [Bacillus thuringiensis serovar yunnanensis]AFQ30120.1 hypothetical protein BTF1_30097 [Bacillus thuringiensis HD-789]
MTSTLSTKRKQVLISNVGKSKVIPFNKLFYHMFKRIETGATISTFQDGLVVRGKFVSLTNLIHKNEIELILELPNSREVELYFKANDIEEVVHGFGSNYNSYTLFTSREVVPIIISNIE